MKEIKREIKKGIYRHYKGDEYRVLMEVKNSETKDELVVYQNVKDEKKLWARPKEMFIQEVEVEGVTKPRFEFIRDEEVDSKDEEMDPKDEEIDSWENKYLRALADYQNLLKQSAKDKGEFVKYALSDFLHNILPVYDHLKISMAGLSEEEMKNPWALGVSYVLKQFKDVLNNYGIEEIETNGKKFDHELMEAIDGSGEVVKKEVTAGYKLNGKVIRHAKVIVE